MSNDLVLPTDFEMREEKRLDVRHDVAKYAKTIVGLLSPDWSCFIKLSKILLCHLLYLTRRHTNKTTLKASMKQVCVLPSELE